MITIKPTNNLWVIASNGLIYVPLAIAKGESLSTAMSILEEYLDRESFLIRLNELQIEYNQGDFIIENITPKADWDTFNLQMITNSRFNQVYSQCLSLAPIVANSLPTALDQVTTRGNSLFTLIWNQLCAVGSATSEDRNNWAELAINNNLPEDFVSILRG
jgi:hypothetical protein